MTIEFATERERERERERGEHLSALMGESDGFLEEWCCRTGRPGDVVDAALASDPSYGLRRTER